MEEKEPDQQQYPQSRPATAGNVVGPGLSGPQLTSQNSTGRAGSVSDDGDLFARGASGDAAAQRALVDRHGRYLFGVAHALTGNPHDAEDVVQETFLGAFGSKFRGESSLRTWLVKILVRRAAMLRRSRRRETSNVSLDAPGVNEPAVASGAPRGAGADARLDLSVMLQTLSPDHREVILLREIEGLSYEEIAKTLGVPRGTVESRLHRARDELRKRFRGYL